MERSHVLSDRSLCTPLPATFVFCDFHFTRFCGLHSSSTVLLSSKNPHQIILIPSLPCCQLYKPLQTQLTPAHTTLHPNSRPPVNPGSLTFVTNSTPSFLSNPLHQVSSGQFLGPTRCLSHDVHPSTSLHDPCCRSFSFRSVILL